MITTQTYLIMYVLMFVAAMRLRRTQPDHPRGYRAPILRTQCVVGGVASVLAFFIGFVPPSQFSGGGVGYVLLVSAGVFLVGFLAPARAPLLPTPELEDRATPAGDGLVMPHDQPPSPAQERPVWLYILLGAIVAGLAIWGVIAYRGHDDTQAANAKARQLQNAFIAAGLPTYSDTNEVARTLGTNGGAVCDTPETLGRAFLKLQLSNGAAGPGQRPIRVAKQTLKGELLIIQTYCPEKLSEFQNFVNSLNYADVVRG